MARLGCQDVVALVQRVLGGVDRTEVAKVLATVRFVARRRDTGGRSHLEVLHCYVGSFVRSNLGLRIIDGKEVAVGELE